jgi:hypothetical protein
MQYPIVVLIIFAMMLLSFRLLCAAVALWLARNDPQRQERLFNTVLTLLSRRPRLIPFPWPSKLGWRTSRCPRNSHQTLPTGTRSITDKSHDRVALKECS